MSEETEPVAPERNIAEMSHRRILILMAVLVVLGSLAGFVFDGVRFGAGIMAGGLLAFANYYWLKRSLKVIFERAKEGGKPRLFAFSYIARYLVFGFIVGMIYLSQAIPVTAVIAGLGSFAIAVVIEGIFRIYTGFFNKRDI
jgi:small-conductance mechanosensitive channel